MPQKSALCLVVWGSDSWTGRLRPWLRKLSLLTGRDRRPAAEEQSVAVPTMIESVRLAGATWQYDAFYSSNLESMDTGSRQKMWRRNARCKTVVRWSRDNRLFSTILRTKTGEHCRRWRSASSPALPSAIKRNCPWHKWVVGMLGKSSQSTGRLSQPSETDQEASLISI
ncbi:hypothetical protein IWX49DRAFT_177848 [Phyllosticta citricarpa]|uniref:Uncharacterized protein n=1 Tax=Phyllosticta citricarpa TaxID=55181 RepID=A0ABR1M2A0_9PEZI